MTNLCRRQQQNALRCLR